MTEIERKLTKQVLDELRNTEAYNKVGKVCQTGEWHDGQYACLFGEVVIRQGGSFKLGASGKYIPADLKTIELCESIITDHPGLKHDSGGELAALLNTKAERIAEAREQNSNE